MAKDDIVRVNTKQIYWVMAIVITLASVVGAAYITYDTSKCNKREISALEIRVRETERRQDKFEGVMEERTKNILEHAKRVDAFMQQLIETWNFDDGKEEISYAKKETNGNS